MFVSIRVRKPKFKFYQGITTLNQVTLSNRNNISSLQNGNLLTN